MTNNKTPGIGVVIGRFQVHNLHEGHHALLAKASEHGKFIVFIGTNPKLVTIDNPLDYPTRELMIKKDYPKAITIALPDQPTDELWSKNLDTLIRTHCPIGDVVLYHGRDSFKNRYHGRFKTVEIESVPLISGTSLRKEVGQTLQESAAFREGVIYASQNNYGQLNMTVDIALVREDTNQILLGTKPNNPGLWRFPGGFVDLNDESAELAAIRELQEETGILVDPSSLSFICSQKIADWRDSANTGTMTNFYLALYQSGKAKASDDLGEVKWFDIADFWNRQPKLVPEHDILGDKLAKYAVKNNLVEKWRRQ